MYAINIILQWKTYPSIVIVSEQQETKNVPLNVPKAKGGSVPKAKPPVIHTAGRGQGKIYAAVI